MDSSGVPAVLRAEEGGMEVVAQLFADRWLVFATDLGKVGAVVSVSPRASEQAQNEAFDVEVALGVKEDLWLRVLAKQLAQRAQAVAKRPLVLLCGIKFEEETADAKVRTALQLFSKAASPMTTTTDEAQGN